MARLTTKTKSGKEYSITLSEVTTIGRDPANLIRIPDDAVSRFHAEIRRVPEGYRLVDLGSSNGTFVNGRRVKKCLLNDGDVVSFAGHEFTYDASERDPVRLKGTEYRSFTRQMLAEDLGRSRTRRLERFGEFVAICELCARAKDSDEFARQLCELLAILFEADFATLLLAGGKDWTAFDPAKGLFVSRASLDELSDTVVTEAAKGEDGVLVADPSSEDRFRNRASLVSNKVATAMAVPFGRDREHGMLYVHRMEPATPFTEDDMKLLFALTLPVAGAISNMRLLNALAEEKRRFENLTGARSGLLGEHPSMKRVRELIARLAPLESTVLITGETGTGKELAARALHAGSPRADAPFVVVNCAAISEALVESELFGHEKGAFTGAESARRGAFESADGGTLFLDEIGELPLQIQAKLLRVLENGEVKRVGGDETRKVDVRVIAATNRNLNEMAEKGEFRKDLLFRINVVNVELPPLRERPSDIPLLARHFVREMGRRLGRRGMKISREAEQRLKSYSWPGNVRELRNVIERAVILSETNEVGPDDVFPQAGTVAASPGAAGNGAEFPPLVELEKRHILKALEVSGGNKKRAAELLGIDRSTLYAKLKSYGLQ